MSKRSSSVRALPIWVAISAVVILAGIILAAVLGFRAVGDVKTIDVIYDASVESAKVQEICEKALDAKNLSYDISVGEEVGTGETMPTGSRRVTCTITSTGADLNQVADSIRSSLQAQYPEGAEIKYTVSVHTSAGQYMGEAFWRGAVALAVGAVVALIYVGIRFDVGKALAGLAACANGALCTFGLLAITRFALVGYLPLLLISVGAVFSLFLWLILCAKMREDFKDPAFASVSAKEAIGESVRGCRKFILAVAAVVAIVLAAFGAVMDLVLLSALIPVVVSVYSSLLLAPAVYAPLKTKFDRFTFKRKRYVGKSKGAAEEE